MMHRSSRRHRCVVRLLPRVRQASVRPRRRKARRNQRRKILVKAALESDPREAIGLDGALQELAGRPYGSVLLGLVAAGLLLYGLYCLVEARYRKL
jgi:hypothetical protein